MGFPPSFAPRRPGADNARRGGDRPSSTDLKLLAQHHIGLILQSCSPLTACDFASQRHKRASRACSLSCYARIEAVIRAGRRCWSQAGDERRRPPNRALLLSPTSRRAGRERATTASALAAAPASLCLCHGRERPRRPTLTIASTISHHPRRTLASNGSRSSGTRALSERRRLRLGRSLLAHCATGVHSPPPGFRYASCPCRAGRPANPGALPRVVPSTSLPEVVDDFCFDSLRRLLAAASWRVEQADGGLGHDCPIPPRAEAPEAESRPPRTSPFSAASDLIMRCDSTPETAVSRANARSRAPTAHNQTQRLTRAVSPWPCADDNAAALGGGARSGRLARPGRSRT